jgi:hypothetical protein
VEIQRRIFLGTLGAGALAASLDAQASETAPASATPGSTWDLSWAERVNRKHRAVFDSPGFGGGGALFRAAGWKRQYKDVYGTAPEDMSSVLVVRHEGIWLAMNDVFWKNYNVGEEQNFKLKDSGKFRAVNPIASPSPEAPPEFADVSIATFVSSGNIVLACHLAFAAAVALVKKTDRLATDEEAEKKAMTFVLPGVIMQPSGVFAALRAQEAGCHYILAS